MDQLVCSRGFGQLLDPVLRSCLRKKNCNSVKGWVLTTMEH